MDIVGINTGDKFSSLAKFFLLQRPADSSIARTGLNLPLSLYFFVLVGNFCGRHIENFENYIQVVGYIFGPRNLSQSVLAFTKVHIVGTS